MISIIVPVYKAEKFISACIESILDQTYTDFELLLIDDGSPDKSGLICDKYAADSDNIFVVHQQNQGATMARKVGVQNAHGEWIAFVDADDTIPNDALENLINCTDNSVDIVLGWIGDSKPTENTLSIEEYRHRNIGRYGLHVGPVAHLYRKSLFNVFTFDIPREINMGEDMLMNIRLSFNTDKSVRVVHKEVYNYNIENAANTTNSFRLSLDYESLMQKMRLLSIPKQYRSYYMNDMIGIRIYDLMRYLDKHPFSISWHNSEFYIELACDIDKYGCQTTRANLLIFKSRSLFVQILMIYYKKLRKMLQK